MEYTKKEKKDILLTIEKYGKFTECGQEKSMNKLESEVHKKDFIYCLISLVGFCKHNKYYERANAIENLTVHLITDTILPIDYVSESGLSLMDLAVIIDDNPIKEALQSRSDTKEKIKKMIKK